jgi:hypothetical protein
LLWLLFVGQSHWPRQQCRGIFWEAEGRGRTQNSAWTETEGHHPDISFGWGYVTVSLSTKKIKGLHENDFIMASKIDRVFDRSGRSLDPSSDTANPLPIK